MQRVTLLDIDPDEIEAVVGPTFFARGVDYARRNAVLSSRWSNSEHALHGQVLGRGEVYETSAYFSVVDGQPYGFEHGECTCPVGFNCKHVAALALTAVADEEPPVRVHKPRTVRVGRPLTPKAPSWAASLDSLLGSADPARRPDAIPLAIELALSPAGRATAVSARLVQPGRTGWIGGSLSWSKLGSLTHQGYIEAQVRVLREFYAVHRTRDPNSGYYADVKSIDFAAFESRRLWPLLDEAEAVGIRLVHNRKALGEVAPYHPAELCLDVTDEGAFVVRPAFYVDGKHVDVVPIRFVGQDGHGLVYTDPTDVQAGDDPRHWHIRLARLTKPVPVPLQRMVLAGQSLEIPAEQASRFRDEYYPRLRHIAPIVSSDETFTPPVISDPTLTLHATYGTGHALELSWEWAYRIDESEVRAPLGPARPEDGYRDAAAERAVLTSLEQSGLPMPGSAETTLAGIDTMRFTTEMLPQLADQAGVAIEIDGTPADYREAGDSVSIGVSTKAGAGETDWFDLDVTITVEGRKVPLTSVFTALATDQPYLLLDDGAYFSLEKPELRTLRQLIEEARALQDSPGGPLRISRYQVGLWDELAALGVVGRQAKAWQRQLAALRSIDEVDTTNPPATLDARLRPYQLDGFRWLAFLWKFQLGGILADDMGLGKTLQSLALICHAKREDPALAPFLVIAPTSVVTNWVTESARFAPGLNVVPIGDTTSRRGGTLAETIAGADVVVTSHTLFRLDFDEYAELPWSGLIMDEAQFAKNHQSKIYQCVRQLPTSFKLAITGTPMENSLMELWSLLSITAPGLFPNPARFAEYYARPIEKQGDADLLARFRRRIKPLVKRRTKEQVAADLPPKQEQVLEVDLAPRHRKIYETYLQRERQKVLGLIDDLNRNRFTILRSLTLLRQLSLHAGLVDEKHAKLSSAKVEALLEQLHDVVDGGHRALVFSQFTGFLDFVRRSLDAAGVPYCYLDGKTRNRAAVVKQFKSGQAPVFLISLKAGGFGLNLTEADYCFLLDPWWNPATEAQAVDRTHRIGQTRNVMVYRLIAKGTIEEKVMELKARKAALFAGVMDEGNAFGSNLDADDIRGLFG
ncbi:SNF2-related protein [Amycolatopsis sp. NPDC021455]|uniref:DEAD/DEAH box helicase n=1 Tax=Amycolatopsis sp. NPDC021455 TaxID=3154901 RepID=UPI0033F94263